jgi:hypothetical protein
MKLNHTCTIIVAASALLIGGCSTTDPSKPRKLTDQEVADSLPRDRIFYPGDPMPTNVIGLRLAGDFAVIGTNADANPKLVPSQDARNPFARQFWMVNVRDTMGPNVYLRIHERPLIQVSPKRPLVIIDRGLVPGVYYVAYQ